MLVLRYFPRQLRDMLLTRGAAMLVVASILLLPDLLRDYSSAPADFDYARSIGRALDGMTFFLTMIATYGIIGEDMRRGYFRFLFCKPISPRVYYVQAFVAAAVTFLVVALLAIGVFAAVVRPVWPGRALADVMAKFLFLGAIIFGLSRLARLDWLFGLFLIILGDAVREAFPASESLQGKVFNILLPPIHVMSPTLFPVEGMDWLHAAWVAGYAALFFAGGLAAVRFIPFGTAR